MGDEKPSRVRRLLELGPALFDWLSQRILNAGALFEGKVKQPPTRAERLKYTRLMGYVAVLRSGGFGALATALPILLVYFGALQFLPDLNPDGTGFTGWNMALFYACLLYTSPSPRDVEESRMPSSA